MGLTAKRSPTCKSSGKKMYPTQRVAIRVLLSCSKKRGTALRTYFHKDCKSWHLTHKVRDNDSQRSIA